MFAIVTAEAQLPWLRDAIVMITASAPLPIARAMLVPTLARPMKAQDPMITAAIAL